MRGCLILQNISEINIDKDYVSGIIKPEIKNKEDTLMVCKRILYHV